MERRQYQRVVESERLYAPQVRQREAGSIRRSLVLGVVIVGLGALIIAGAVVSVMSLADTLRGHPGETRWHSS
jgi:hypothetical protein